ncbi:conserved hypothetical protein [Culex quinquefasciatus]|uniref:Uncharacterized protein n=1 Tax=Culex quinquefasciatus TaxID=7176 RepID=B0WGF4_CULQU|nr:conserved hypothetical protein [Culex quinquefasciatus]|eukprot:XP_001847788.1 conserved hypothetical protein [Culex quinquefasciatus]
MALPGGEASQNQVVHPAAEQVEEVIINVVKAQDPRGAQRKAHLLPTEPVSCWGIDVVLPRASLDSRVCVWIGLPSIQSINTSSVRAVGPDVKIQKAKHNINDERFTEMEADQALVDTDSTESTRRFEDVGGYVTRSRFRDATFSFKQLWIRGHIRHLLKVERIGNWTHHQTASAGEGKGLRLKIKHTTEKIVAAGGELQHERDVLQERMSEQSLKITTLQSKLDEQRMRAEELHRQGTSHLTVRVHDLQEELVNLRETLHTRDKQIDNLKNFLENSRQVIERQEKELAMTQASNDRSQFEIKLEAELQAKTDEVQQLKHKIQHEMINKVALPDLMETMLADKNDEIDQLREKLNQLQQTPAAALATKDNDDNARTLSDIVSITDCDESADMVMRRAPEQSEAGAGFFPPPLPHSIPMKGKDHQLCWSEPGFEPRSTAYEAEASPLGYVARSVSRAIVI